MGLVCRIPGKLFIQGNVLNPTVWTFCATHVKTIDNQATLLSIEIFYKNFANLFTPG